MERQFIAKNTQERERLRNLVASITDEELTLTINAEGWTVAVALAHLVFWDQRRLILIRKWKEKGVSPSPITDEDIVNDAMVPLLLAIPPRKAADMSVSTAEVLDKELEEVSSDLIEVIETLGDPHALDRSIHRKMHLDEIETLLRTKRQTG